MAEDIRFEHRMSDSDALMWKIEKDPLLRSTITVVWVLDCSPDHGRLEEKIERATRSIPRLRQRVVSNPMSIAPPRWEADPHFDPSFHIRWMRAPGEGRLRDLLDLAQPIAMQGFDRARPLWELSVIEGLEQGKAGLILKLHHSLSDGVGLVQMTTSMVESYRTPDPKRTKRAMPPLPEMQIMNQRERFVDALAHEQRHLLGRAMRSAEGIRSGLGRAMGDPRGAGRDLLETLTSVSRALAPATQPASPIMRERSLSLHFEALRIPLEPAKAAAKRVGGKLNDAFVAGVTGGLRLYHERHAAPVESLRMSMPINLRPSEGNASAGNHFVPARFSVPIGIADPIDRMAAIRDLVRGQRSEAALPLVEEVSAVLNRFPTAVASSMFGAMLKGVDFVTSNVPGPRTEVFMSGARIESIWGFGPLSGSAANITVFSYRDELGVAVNTDRAAVPDAEVFRECLEAGFEEVLRCA